MATKGTRNRKISRKEIFVSNVTEAKEGNKSESGAKDFEIMAKWNPLNGFLCRVFCSLSRLGYGAVVISLMY
jgi:hypothetical protein